MKDTINLPVVAEFEDRFGEKRRIHKGRNGLAVKRENRTVSLTLTKAVGQMIGARIKLRRTEQGMGLAELCIKAGFESVSPKSRMFEIESGTRGEGIRFGTLYAIATALGCEASELLPSCKDVALAAGVKQSKQTRLTVVA